MDETQSWMYLLVNKSYKQINVATNSEVNHFNQTFYLSELMVTKRSLVEEYFKIVLRLVDERGLAFTVGYIEKCRLSVIRYLTGHPLDAIDGVALKEGWPIQLSSLKELTSSENSRNKTLNDTGQCHCEVYALGINWMLLQLSHHGKVLIPLR